MLSPTLSWNVEHRGSVYLIEIQRVGKVIYYVAVTVSHRAGYWIFVRENGPVPHRGWVTVRAAISRRNTRAYPSSCRVFSDPSIPCPVAEFTNGVTSRPRYTGNKRDRPPREPKKLRARKNVMGQRYRAVWPETRWYIRREHASNYRSTVCRAGIRGEKFLSTYIWIL